MAAVQLSIWSHLNHLSIAIALTMGCIGYMPTSEVQFLRLSLSPLNYMVFPTPDKFGILGSGMQIQLLSTMFFLILNTMRILLHLQTQWIANHVR